MSARPVIFPGARVAARVGSTQPRLIARSCGGLASSRELTDSLSLVVLQSVFTPGDSSCLA